MFDDISLFFSNLGCTIEADNRPTVVTLHYMYFSLILCVITFTVAVVISLFTGPPTSEQVILNFYCDGLHSLDKLCEITGSKGNEEL